jgi:hypothetical protein
MTTRCGLDFRVPLTPQLLYQKIFPDVTQFLPEEEGARYRAEFEKEWERVAAA